MSDPTNPNSGPETAGQSNIPTRGPTGPELARGLDMLLVTYVAYLLGLVTFLGGVVGVIIAYLKRPEVAGTWRESHYTWLIRTFWIGIVFAFIGSITIFIAIGFVILFATFVWFIVRLIKGWMAYTNEQPIQKPEDWFFG